LCSLRPTVFFCNETEDDFEPIIIQGRICFKNSVPVLVTEDVLSRLNGLNINKPAGPDLIHPRVIYELRHEIARSLGLTMLVTQ